MTEQRSHGGHLPRIIAAQRHGDARGWFAETYSEARFAALGIDTRFVQDNHSRSAPAWTLRGLHLQRPPQAQAKLVRCLHGRIFDVVVDLRAGSPDYGRWTATELSAAEGQQLFVPAGFAHGFLTLEPGCEVAYKVSAPYAPACEDGVAWDDPAIAVAWPLPPGQAPELSAKDRTLAALAAFDSPFGYDGHPLRALA